ncbi:hypothetical protein RDWZM_000673 [Blomia tropicalis]|uniref:TFIIS N-terminal domain-containing protein n=1 Tax=Blomia tropicalis TaxID=40697 RepID=A0A9Q0RN81_BLOTA|nr:Transcription factor iws1 [Blomia tropicalis]KAJ6222128.1 hypothetical protein RDWZM_000673 [Blomia tropicalis]
MSDTENIVRDIFGDSDESDAEFEGFDGDETKNEKKVDNKDKDDEEVNKLNDSEAEEQQPTEPNHEKAKELIPDLSESDSDDEELNRNEKSGIVYDFDIMLQRRKEMNSKRRGRRKNVDIINDSDDIIAELIHEMRQAADDDFDLNRNQKVATRKLKMLPLVQVQLKKFDLKEALLESGILNVITDWLTRLPDGSLPHLQIRTSMLKILMEFNIEEIDRIKSSGIGKAVMYLCKHPKETKENKRYANQLIANWSRPIFNLDTNFHSISRDEREQRDFEHMSRFKRRHSDAGEGSSSKTEKSTDKILKPGDKGWVPRARVPMPSMKDYVIRPKSNVDIDMTRISTKKTVGRFEKHMRNFREMKKASKSSRAVPISIEGRKMAL